MKLGYETMAMKWAGFPVIHKSKKFKGKLSFVFGHVFQKA